MQAGAGGNVTGRTLLLPDAAQPDNVTLVKTAASIRALGQFSFILSYLVLKIGVVGLNVGL
jgi:hypothetical protein